MANERTYPCLLCADLDGSIAFYDAGLPASPHHALAARYLPRGAGSVFTFGVRGGFEAGVRVVESVELWSHLANVGDTRSLILHPASRQLRSTVDRAQDRRRRKSKPDPAVCPWSRSGPSPSPGRA